MIVRPGECCNWSKTAAQSIVTDETFVKVNLYQKKKKKTSTELPLNTKWLMQSSSTNPKSIQMDIYLFLYFWEGLLGWAKNILPPFHIKGQ